MYFDARRWTEEMASENKKDKERLEILTNPTAIQIVGQDYPA